MLNKDKFFVSAFLCLFSGVCGANDKDVLSESHPSGSTLSGANAADEIRNPEHKTSVASVSCMDQVDPVGRDRVSLIGFLKERASGEDCSIQIQLGDMYHTGKIVPCDQQKAMEWYLKAANQNYPRAFYKIGKMFEYGYGVSRDITKAIEYYEKGSDDLLARGRLEILTGKNSDQVVTCHEPFNPYEEEEKKYQDAKINYLEQNYDDAFELFKNGAKNGHPNSQYMTGKMYRRGMGTKSDVQKAIKYYNKAADQGHPGAMNDLGVLYARGEDAGRGISSAQELFSKAAALGHEDALKNFERLQTRFEPKDLNNPVKSSSMVQSGKKTVRFRMD